MPSQGSRYRRLAGRTLFALALILSLALHLLLLSLVDWSWPAPVDKRPAPTIELRLRSQQVDPEPASTVSETMVESEEEPIEIPEKTISKAEPEHEPDPDPEPHQDPPPQTPTLDFNSMVRDTVKTLEGDDPDMPLGGGRPGIGGSAFDPRLRERIRQSEDINTAAPAKRSRVRSWQEPGGDLYVEVGDGSCFKVRKSWEAGMPAAWEFTRCRSRGEKLRLDPKPYAAVD
ncbi:hypothetical protein F6455_13300 [Proteobacteria bacterium 005FR1]|nr:hypothetical protein [Proteobacteria bacterium 005FR1]